MTADEVRALIDYDPSTGAFQWKARSNAYFDKRRIGRSVGAVSNKGYLRITINKKRYLAHRLAILIQEGEWPQGEVDHINGEKTDNRYANLRVASRHENMQNTKLFAANSSGYAGVSIDRSTSLWRARITHKRKEFHLGSYKTKEEAYQAYLVAKAKYHSFQPVPRKEAA
jgi:hypothetical protein